MRHASIYYAMLRYLKSLEAAANTDPEVQGALLVLNMVDLNLKATALLWKKSELTQVSSIRFGRSEWTKMAEWPQLNYKFYTG